MDDSMDDSWDAIKTAVATAPLNRAYAISIHELRSGVVNARGALQAMNKTQHEADHVQLREIATTNLQWTAQVIDELFVDILGQRLKRE